MWRPTLATDRLPRPSSGFKMTAKPHPGGETATASGELLVRLAFMKSRLNYAPEISLAGGGRGECARNGAGPGR